MPSSLALASVLPSGEKATARTVPSCPRKVAFSANVVRSAEAPRALETSGVVVVTETGPAPTPPPLALPVLQTAVERVCGKRANVHLVSRSASNLLVQFKAQDAGEAERLTNAILTLPELMPYRVDVDVRLER